MRVVLDTSVFVEGILNPNGGSGELLRLWREDALFEVIARVPYITQVHSSSTQNETM